MTIINKINNFIAVFIDGIKALFYVRLWTPFFLFMMISLFVAYMMLHPYNSLWSGLITSIGQSKLFGGHSAFLHYPTHMLMVSSVFGRVNHLISIIFESVLTASAFIIFVGFFEERKIKFGFAFKQVIKKYHLLVLTSIVIYALFSILNELIPPIFLDMFKGSPRKILLFAVIYNFFIFAVLAPFIYMVPYIVIKDEGIFSAFKKSVKTFFKNSFTSYFMIFVTQILVLPFSLALTFGSIVADRFSPDMLGWLLYGQIGVYFIASIIFTAMMTRIFVEYHE